MYPHQVSGFSGTVRWQTSDARTHDTKAQAMDAQAALGPRSDTLASYEAAFKRLSRRQRWLVRRDDFLSRHFGMILAVVISLIAVSLVTAGWQCVRWLQTGEWPKLTWLNGLDWIGLHHPRVTWVGLDHILTWVLDLPLALLPILIACLLLWLVITSGEEGELDSARNSLRQRPSA
jgi:hypothetical protein